MICAKDNPFTTRRLEAMGFLWRDISSGDLQQRLLRLNYMTAIVGAHGSGKTTLLDYLEARTAQSGVPTAKIFFSLDVRPDWKTAMKTVLTLSENGVLFFDGANHLPRLQWMRLRHTAHRRKIGLVITSHGKGLLPTLIHLKPGPELLIEIVNHLLDGQAAISKTELNRLYLMHQGNIRDCLRQLYEQFGVGKYI